MKFVYDKYIVELYIWWFYGVIFVYGKESEKRFSGECVKFGVCYLRHMCLYVRKFMSILMDSINAIEITSWKMSKRASFTPLPMQLNGLCVCPLKLSAFAYLARNLWEKKHAFNFWFICVRNEAHYIKTTCSYAKRIDTITEKKSFFSIHMKLFRFWRSNTFFRC